MDDVQHRDSYKGIIILHILQDLFLSKKDTKTENTDLKAKKLE
jgi:hypothetical protein